MTIPRHFGSEIGLPLAADQAEIRRLRGLFEQLQGDWDSEAIYHLRIEAVGEEAAAATNTSKARSDAWLAEYSKDPAKYHAKGWKA